MVTMLITLVLAMQLTSPAASYCPSSQEASSIERWYGRMLTTEHSLWDNYWTQPEQDNRCLSSETSPQDAHEAVAVAKFTEDVRRELIWMRNNAYSLHKPWFGRFEAPQGGNDWVDAMKQEKENVRDLRWVSNKLGSYSSNDGESLGVWMLTRIKRYIEQNNIQSLNLYFEQFVRIRDHVGGECTDHQDEVMCDLTAVWDHLKSLVEADHAFGRTREELGLLYLLNPTVEEIFERRGFNLDNLKKWRLDTMYPSLFNHVLNKQDREIKNHFGKFEKILNDTLKVCPEENKDPDNTYCVLSDTFKRMDKLVEAYERSGQANWKEEEAKERRFAVLIWLLISPTKTHITVDAQTQADVTTELLQYFYGWAKTNDVDNMQRLSSYLPSPEQMRALNKGQCTPQFGTLERDLSCSFELLLSDLVVFISTYNSAGDRTKRINTDYLYKQRLEDQQISNVASAVEGAKLQIMSDLNMFTNQILEYQKESGKSRFQTLEDYFVKLADYDGKIIDADIGFVKGKLKEFKEEANRYKADLSHSTDSISESVEVLAGLNAAFKWVNVITTSIAASVGAMGGDFSGFIDVKDRIDEAADATNTAIRAGKIRDRVVRMSNMVKGIMGGLERNKDFLVETEELVRSAESGDDDEEASILNKQEKFLKRYNEYTPQVDSYHIEELNAGWETIVGGLRDVLDGIDDVSIAAGKGAIYSGQYIEKMEINLPALTELLNSRFEFQFEYMDLLADSIRAKLAKTMARGLQSTYQGVDTSDYDRNLRRQVALKTAALNTLLIAQLHTMQTVMMYCNVLQYVSAGVRPGECDTALSTLDRNDINNLLAKRPLSCNERNAFVRIPVSKVDKLGAINLKKLYAKEETTFRIPDSNWLEENGWIISSQNKAGSVNYVKELEIYLVDSQNQGTREIALKVWPSTSGNLTMKADGMEDDRIRYRLIPAPVYEPHYLRVTLGDSGEPCGGKRINNPYNLGVCDHYLKQVCVRSKGTLGTIEGISVYPSVFSQWTVRVTDLPDSVTMPDFVDGTLSLVAMVNLCQFVPHDRQSRRKRFTSGRNLVKRSCTVPAEGTYKNYKSDRWEACPSGSTPALGGFYCAPSGDNGSWTRYPRTYLSGYSGGVNKYSNLEQAQSECLRRTDCGGVTYEPPISKYTLRRGSSLRGSPGEEISWKHSSA